MVKTIKNIIFGVYAVVAIIVTILLLSYNDYKVSEIGSYTLLLISDSSLAPEFNKGDLVILNKNDDIHKGKDAFFYEIANQKREIKLGTIEEAEIINETEITYTLKGNKKISKDYIIGPSNTAEIIPVLGTVLSILESKWGFLFIIVLPALILVINQIGIVFSNIIQAIKSEKNDNKDENKE